MRVEEELFAFFIDLNETYPAIASTCAEVNVMVPVCYCRDDFRGDRCQETIPQLTQCYVNVTDPPVYQGCTGEDTAYYHYSLPGFDPCFFFEEDAEITLSFVLECQVNEPLIGGGVYAELKDANNSAAEKPLFEYYRYDERGIFSFPPDAVNGGFEVVNFKYLSRSRLFGITAGANDRRLFEGEQAQVLITLSLLSEDEKVGGRVFLEPKIYSTTFSATPWYQGFHIDIGSTARANSTEPSSLDDRQEKSATAGLGSYTTGVAVMTGVFLAWLWRIRNKASERRA